MTNPITHFAPDTSAEGIARRRFLQGMLAVGGAAAVTPSWLGGTAFAGPPLKPNEGILVLVMLGGGNDGLNTVAPAGSSLYRSLRGDLAINPAQSHSVGKGHYLHPSMPRLNQRFHRGDVAFVHGVGDPTDDHSHFSAMAKWMDGRTAPNFRSGWAGRALDRLGGDLLSGVSVGWSGIPLHMQGDSLDTIGMPPSGHLFGASPDPHEVYATNTAAGLGNVNHGKGPVGDLVGDAMTDAIQVARQLNPAMRDVNDIDLTTELALCARLINLDVGIRMLNVELGSFDTHDTQALPHVELLDELDRAIETFFAKLNPAFANRVTLMTFSEFGRRVEANGSGGTDHGAGSTMIVAGQQVKGGHYGPFADLSALTERGDVASDIDFRRYYATFLENWFGVSTASVLGANFSPIDFLNAPGSSTGSKKQPEVEIPPPGTLYAPLVPHRLLDTREGQGPYGPKTIRELKVTGVGGVPAGLAGAVVLNVTSTEATAPSYLTVWPSGQPRPHASNLNTVPGENVPNLVIAKVGAGGKVSIYNHAGSGHVVADVMGWFPTDSNYGPLTPARLLDTREGQGAYGPKTVRDLKVTGVGGVPKNAGAVVLNVTSTAADQSSYLTVWPTGQPQPHASNVNTVPGEDVPNLVIAKVGADGQVSIYNHAGSGHVVVDVMGWFPAGSKFGALTPARLLDTREGQGPYGPQMVRNLKVTGVGGVPANAGAVVVNVTSTACTETSYLTVWPTGAPRPHASNVNTVPHTDVPNLAIAKVGNGGQISIYNHAGYGHVVFDVMGWMPGW